MDPVQLARDLRLRGLADAIVITGRETGAEADVEQFRRLRDSVDAPLVVGSGLTAGNAARFAAVADGAIVGTSIKSNGDVSDPVSADRMKRIAEAWRA
jgi:predicted TIM-barrel enzyme